MYRNVTELKKPTTLLYKSRPTDCSLIPSGLEVVILTYPSLTKYRFSIGSPITKQLASNNAPEK